MPSALTCQNLQTLLRELKLPAQDQITAGLTSYLQQLLQWNRAINLCGLNDWQMIVRKLVLDSFYLANLFSELALPECACICDLGAGAGLPGIPLRLIYPHGNYLLLEKRAKRAIFLRNVLAQLKLPRTEVVEADIVDYAVKHPGCADLVLSRAFLPFPALAEAAKPFLKPQSYLLVLSSKPFAEKQTTDWKAIRLLNYRAEAKERWLWLLQASTI